MPSSKHNKSTPSPPASPTPSPSQRLSQVTGHLNPPTTTKDSPKSTKRTKSVLPADYSDILTQLTTLRTIASTTPLKSPGYIRQKQSGKLWVRERVLSLLDPDSFQEIGSVAGTVTWSSLPDNTELISDFTPSNNVQGFGLLQGRKCLLTADDFTLRAGHADGSIMAKTIYIEKLALALRLPIIKLVDGSSGGGSVTTLLTTGASYIPPMPTFGPMVSQLNAGIPNLGAVLGPAIGLGAARVVGCHFSVMAADVGSLFNAGPKVVAKATFEEDLSLTDLGGPEIHCTNGTIDNLAANETECFAQLRTILTYLPNSGGSLPTIIPPSPDDDPISRLCPDLRTLIPRRRQRTYSARHLIRTVVDTSSFFEIGPTWGRTAIVGLARLGGYPVGIISLDPSLQASALCAHGCQKITRHLKFCDVFNLPIVQFIDIAGFAIGTRAERDGTMRFGLAMSTTYFSTTMPIFSVVTRKVYGVAGGVMLDSRDPVMRVAWLSGEWGSLPLEGGIEASHSAELRRAEREGGVAAREKLYAELETEYRKLMNPVRTAAAFGVEEIIDPASTRRVVGEWTAHVYESLLPARLLERANGKIRPVFY